MHQPTKWYCLPALVLVAATSSLARPPEPTTEVRRLADQVAALKLAYEPTLAYAMGVPVADHSRLPDHREAATRAFERAEDALARRTGELHAETVSEADAPTYALLREVLAADRQARVCHSKYWNVSHFSGWQVVLADAAAHQPSGTAASRAQALHRWRSLPRYVEAEIHDLRIGLARGYSVPKSVVRRVVQQLDAILALPPERSPFYTPAARDSDARFRASFRALLVEKITPAVRRYRDFLKDQYLLQARDSLGIAALPDGPACYRALLRLHTTLDRSAEEVYALGRRTVEENRAAVLALGKEIYDTEDFGEIVQRTREAPENHFASAEDLLGFSTKLLERAVRRSRELFVDLPAQAVVIRPIPAYQAGSGLAAHYETEPDKLKPGRYMCPVEEWRSDTLGNAEITLVHETLPGHHLQIATANELPQRTALARLATVSAYTEGWGRYAERLADDSGIYTTTYARITRRIWPARGMVLDPGLHVFGWTRQQAIDYLKETGRFDERTADALVDRSLARPGQLTAYDTGGLEIAALRREAEAALGPAFDLKAFHQRVLEEGAVPLERLRAHVREWVRNKEAGSRR